MYSGRWALFSNTTPRGRARAKKNRAKPDEQISRNETCKPQPQVCDLLNFRAGPELYLFAACLSGVASTQPTPGLRPCCPRGARLSHSYASVRLELKGRRRTSVEQTLKRGGTHRKKEKKRK